MKNRIFDWCVLVILPIAVGILFYLLLCPDVIFVRKISAITGITAEIHVNTVSLPYVIFRNYGIDFLWAFAFMASAGLISGTDKRFDVFFWLIMAAEIVLECIQIIPGVNGTFDICDIIVEIAAGIIADIIVIKKQRRSKNEKN